MKAQRTSAALLTAALLTTGSVALVATPATAAVGDVVCDMWPSGDLYNVHVEQTADRSYTVNFTDFSIAAAEASRPGVVDEYATLPIDLRLSRIVVTLTSGLEVSDVSISQGVVSGPGADGMSTVIDSYVRAAPAPWEEVNVEDSGILWVHDIDAYSDENGVQAVPSDYFFPGAAYDHAAGVLTFTVTLPDDVEGEVALFEGVETWVTQGIRNADTDEWTAGETISDAFGGCSVIVEAVDNTDEGEDGDDSDEGGVDPEVPVAPTPPKKVETAALGRES